MRKESIWKSLSAYMTVRDGRYEDLKKGNITHNIFDDLIAGSIVAAVAIPLAMGFAMASGLRPEQGIVGGAIAGLFGAVFGGSKYQVYGPTAAFIPVIAGLMATYDHGFMVMASLMAGLMLLGAGYFELGHLVWKIPYSIVVGFSTGVAIIIACSQIGPALGFKESIGYRVPDQLVNVFKNVNNISLAAILMVVFTIVFCKAFEKVSYFIPGPVPAMIFGYIGAQTFWRDSGLILIEDQYGNIPSQFFAITLPSLPSTMSGAMVFDLFYYAITIFLIASFEGLMCGRASDRMANNRGIPFSPTRELRGQGMINIFSPLLNGFPHTGALGRTALNIRMRGSSPLSIIAQSLFVIMMAMFFAEYLGRVPMACIAGILLYVAYGMIKKREIREIVRVNNYHVVLMYYTMIAVPMFGFLLGILSALVIYVICNRVYQKKDNGSIVSRRH